MSVSPHLPPPTCDIKRHHQLQRLKVLLVATFFGLLAGLTGASIILGWVWPGYGGGNILFNAQQNRLAWSNRQLEERVQKEISDRIVSVYSTESVLGSNSYFNQNDKLGEAIIISSDGWLAMYLPKITANIKRARVLTMNGSVYELEKILTDPRSGLAFLKISLSKAADQQRAGGQFPVVSLADKVDINDEVFIFERDTWRSSLVSADIWNVWPWPHLDSAPTFAYTLSDSFPDGSILINSQGRAVGFMVSENVFFPITYLARIMPSVLDKQKVIYISLASEGWFDDEQPIIIKTERARDSFLVSRVESRQSLLKAGDIITEINGQIVTPDNLWYNINGSKTVRLKVWRAGKTVEIETPTMEIK